MSYLINNQQKVNDIIFANRNKNYGAYAIRSTYGNTLLKSLIIMISGFGTFVGMAYYLCNKHNTDNLSGQVLPDVCTNTIVDLTPKVNKLKKTVCPPAAPPEGHKTEAKGALTVVDSTLIEKPAKPMADANPNAMANGTASAAMPVGDTDGPEKGKPGDGFDDEKVIEPFGVDSQPEFEGGLPALYKFVSKNMRYPAMASDAGQEGTVYVKFVVDEKGKVSNLKLLNNAGFGFDDEALRVIGLIPNFKTPAKVNGRPVKMYYQMPIKFRMR